MKYLALFTGLLAMLTAAEPCSAAVGVPVPKPTASGQTIISNPTAPYNWMSVPEAWTASGGVATTPDTVVAAGYQVGKNPGLTTTASTGTLTFTITGGIITGVTNTAPVADKTEQGYKDVTG